MLSDSEHPQQLELQSQLKAGKSFFSVAEHRCPDLSSRVREMHSETLSFSIQCTAAFQYVIYFVFPICER